MAVVTNKQLQLILRITLFTVVQYPDLGTPRPTRILSDLSLLTWPTKLTRIGNKLYNINNIYHSELGECQVRNEKGPSHWVSQ